MAELRVWTDDQGVTWACDAYDHGPLCRRCEPIDGVEIVRDAQRRLREMWEAQCRS